jgi:hypothetical protein
MTPFTVSGPDRWRELAEEHWGRRPVLLPGGRAAPSPLSAAAAFDLLTRAAGPFRSGTRFRALPDVTYVTTDGRLRAPGHRLPGPEDAGLTGYLRRSREAAPDGSGWLLNAEHPLLIDFALWSRCRDTLAALWRRVGWPSLPVTVEITLAHRYDRLRGTTLPASVTVLTWVLSGSLTVRLWREDGTTPPADLGGQDAELTAGPGELLYWPADHRYAERYGEGCLTLRVTVPAEYRAAISTVKNVLCDQAQATAHYADPAPPVLPWPPPPRPARSRRAARPRRPGSCPGTRSGRRAAGGAGGRSSRTRAESRPGNSRSAASL